MSPAEIEIAGRKIGAGHPPYVIAEAGVHHYDSLALAREYILQARIAGADAIKFQTYSADGLVTRWAPLYWDDPRFKTQHDVFAAKRGFTREEYAELFAHAAELGIVLLSTPFSNEAVDMLDSLDMPAFKVASADLTNLPLLRHIARTGKPMLISTGACGFDEIEHVLATIRPINDRIALLHCSLGYPTPVDRANMARIGALAARFPGVVLGYSDHTQPRHSALPTPVSVAHGARVLEKHFSLNLDLSGDDHYHSVDTQGLKTLVKDCRDVFAMTGTGAEITDVEAEARRQARRSIVAARDLEAGRVLEEGDLAFKGTGVSPLEAESMIGCRLTQSVAADDLLTWEKTERPA